MNNVSNNDYEEVSIFEGQFIAFYVIVLLMFISSLNTCIGYMNENRDKLSDVFQGIVESKWNSEYFVPVCSLPSFCILYGPILFTFYVSLSENLEKDCILFAFAHIYTNIICFSLRILYLLNDNYENYIFQRGQPRVKVSMNISERRVIWNQRTYMKLKIEDIEKKNIKQFGKIFIILFFLSFGFYFQKYFISECNEITIFIESIIYLLSLVGSYTVLNFTFLLKDYYIVESIYDYKDYYVLFSNSITCFFVACFSLTLQILTKNNYISRKAFYSVLLFINVSHLISFVMIHIFVIFNPPKAMDLSLIHLDKVSFIAKTRIYPEEDEAVENLWKNDEKPQRAKNKNS